MAKVLAVLGVLLLLAGCAANPGDPVGAGQRAQIRSLILNNLWGQVAAEYPGAARPSVPVTHTVLDHDYPDLMVACLTRKGLHAVRTDLGFITAATFGESLQKQAIEGFECSAEYIPVSQLFTHISRSQLDAFDRFLVTDVQACLKLAGAPTSKAPPGVSPNGITGLEGWTPYDELWKRKTSPTALAYLELRCPPIPSGLELKE